MALIGHLWSTVQIIALMKNVLFICVGILGIGFIIGFHEFGHFLFHKLFNVKVPSFSIGMGPKILSRKIGETNFSISLLPVGGYVEYDPTGFDKKPYWQKFLVMSGGIMFNLIFAYGVFIALHGIGMPRTMVPPSQNSSPIIANVIKGSPADKGHLKQKDAIIALDGQNINDNVENLMTLIAERANKEVAVTVKRSGSKKTLNIQLGEQAVGRSKFGYLGVEFKQKTIKRESFFSAIKNGFIYTNRLIYKITLSLKAMITKKDMKGLGGPIMVMSQTVQFAGQGFKLFLALLALLSINLAILNLVPIPIMDGGQLLLATIEAIAQRRLPMKIKEIIFGITWLLLITLTIFLTVRDVKNIYNDKINKNSSHQS